MSGHQEHLAAIGRRAFLQRSTFGLGALAMHSLSGIGGHEPTRPPHYAPRAKRVVYLFQAGGPSPFETFDSEPELQRRHGQGLPKSVLGGQRLTGMSGNQATLPLAGSFTNFQQVGDAGLQVSDLLPHTRRVASFASCWRDRGDRDDETW